MSRVGQQKGEENHLVSFIPFQHHHRLSCLGIADIQGLFGKAIALEGAHTNLKNINRLFHIRKGETCCRPISFLSQILFLVPRNIVAHEKGYTPGVEDMGPLCVSD